MAAKRAFVATVAALALLVGAFGPSSGAQDGGDPPPPPLAGDTTLATVGQFPAIAYLKVDFPDAPFGQFATCTGTLIDPMWVLTAAHCVQMQEGQEGNDAGTDVHAINVDVMLGSVDGTEIFNPGPGVEVHTAEAWILHGNWDPVAFAYDVALLKLPTPSAMTPMQLATNEALVDASNGNPLPSVTTGFGRCGPACNDSLLRWGDTDIWSDSDAMGGVAIPGAFFLFEAVTQNKAFFLGPDLSSEAAICPGDSGGPLLVMQNGSLRVAGVNSFISEPPGEALDCGGGTDNSYLNGIADVVTSNLKSWVNQVIDPPSEMCWGRTPTIEGTSYPDKIIGGLLADVFHGRGGADYIWGRGSRDRLCGGPSGDEMHGGSGADRMKGNSGDDFMDGFSAGDIMDGGGGDDLMFGFTGADTMDGEKGRDTIFGEDGADELRGGSSGDTIRGGDDDDTILGGTGNDDLRGNGGKDDIRGEDGNDDISGGKSGDDLRGGAGRDEIDGNSGKDDLWGNSGDDDLHGGSGDDALLGGTGDDDMNGGSGVDSCGGGPGSDPKTNCES